MSSEMPSFCGKTFAHNAEVISMTGGSEPTVKTFPRNIGCILKPNGIVEKSITLNCRVMPPSGATRAELEQFMNTVNEGIGTQIGTLSIDGNDYLNCGIKTINYQPFIVKNFLVFDVEFAIGVQSTDDTQVQLTPISLYEIGRGRSGKFTVTNTVGTSVFNLWHNVDIVRNLDNRLVIKSYNKYTNEQSVKFGGGIEKIQAYCWMNGAPTVDTFGWRQTVGAYMFNMMSGPVGRLGTFELGGNTIENCFWSGVKLTELRPSSARYELEFYASLQC